MSALLFFFVPSLFVTEAALAQAGPGTGSCIRYVYADSANTKENRMPIFACRDIVNNRASNCTRLGSLDVKKLDAAKKRALEKMWAFSRGLLAGYSCQLGAMAMPMAMRRIGPAASTGLHVDRRTAKERMAQRARDNALAGTRELGSLPSEERGEVVETGLSQACSWVRHNVMPNTPPSQIDGRDAYNLGVDTALSHFRSSAAITAVLHGDAEAIRKLYKEGTIEHREAVKRFHAKIEQERKRQEDILAKVMKQGTAFYRFMMDNSLTTIAFGYSAEGVDNNLPCAAPDAITSARKKLCELARATAKIETYVPGDLFGPAKQGELASRIDGAEQETRAWVEENCKPDVAKSPGLVEKSEPGFPVPPAP